MPHHGVPQLEKPLHFTDLGPIDGKGIYAVETLADLVDFIGKTPLSPVIDFGDFASLTLHKFRDFFRRGFVILDLGVEQHHHFIRSHHRSPPPSGLNGPKSVIPIFSGREQQRRIIRYF